VLALVLAHPMMMMMTTPAFLIPTTLSTISIRKGIKLSSLRILKEYKKHKRLRSRRKQINFKRSSQAQSIQGHLHLQLQMSRLTQQTTTTKQERLLLQTLLMVTVEKRLQVISTVRRDPRNLWSVNWSLNSLKCRGTLTPFLKTKFSGPPR